VSDRVLQRAVLNVLAPSFEQVFLEGSYGYRPERSVALAVEKVLQARDRGYVWVLDADIENCFDNLDHAVILDGVRQVVSNHTLLRLLEMWLEAGRRSGGGKLEVGGRRSEVGGQKETGEPTSTGEKGKKRRVGVPLGAVVSPLLCNIALHPLDVQLERAGWPWARYADDFVVLTRSEAEALEAWDIVESALAALHLELKTSKTWVTSFERGFKFLGVTFQGDTYSYVYNRQRVVVRGRNVSVLWEKPPEGYEWAW